MKKNKNILEIELQKFDRGLIGYVSFINRIRVIAKNFKSKNEIIAEYLEEVKRDKELVRKQSAIRHYKTWMAKPGNKERRSQKDRERYEKNKAVGNI